MNQEFNIAAWNYDRLIKENKVQKHIGVDELNSIYDFLMIKLDSPAKSAGLRMSLFEQEFPTATSFMHAYSNGAEQSTLPKSNMDENLVANVETIDITHTEQDGEVYKISVSVDGKEERLSEDDLNGLISSIIGEDVKIPEMYNPRQFAPIEAKLKQKGIEVDYNDFMDIS